MTTEEIKEFERLNARLAYLEAQWAKVKARTPYPQFCSTPHLCANKGTCQREWVCNE